MPLTMRGLVWFALLLMPLGATSAYGAGTIVEVSYPASDKPGELAYGVTYRAWFPDGVKRLRGVIVHQHGCGAGACKGARRPPTTSTGRPWPGNGAAPCSDPPIDRK